MMEPIQRLKRRLSDLKGKRAPHEQTWRDCFDHVHPIRGSGFYGYAMTAAEAQNRKANILDTTATDSARILTSALMTGLTPPNSRWFELDVGDQPSDDERTWLDETAEVIFDNIHAGNFDASAFEACTDVVDAGWFVLYIQPDPQGGYLFEQWPLPQCFLSSSRAGGIVDTVYREYRYTIEQCVNEFGIDKVSDSVRDKYNADKLDEMVDLVHAIEPRAVSMVGAKQAKNMAFASWHFETQGQGTVLRMSGYPEFPCAAPRWMLIPDSCYGTGPVSDALPDIKTLNEIRRMQLASLDLSISGMWGAVDDGVLNPQSVTVGPRKIIVVNDKESFFPLNSGVDFNVGFMAEDRLQAQIRKILLADQLQPQEGPAMTATEVQVRVQMIRQLLGPIYGRLQSEYLQPLIERCFGIAWRASEPAWASGNQGVFNPPPQSLQNKSFHIRYISPLARAQKMEEVNAIDAWVGPIMEQAAALQDLSLLDVVNFEQANRDRATGLGVPSNAVNDDKIIAGKRQVRAQQQAAAQRQAQAAAVQTEVQTHAGKAAVTPTAAAA